MKYFLIVLSLMLLASCHSTRRLKLTSKAITFKGDSSLFFNGAQQEIIAYNYLSGLLPTAAVIKPDKKVTIPITQPTIFRAFQTSYLVYPGEDITISIDENELPLFKTKDDEQRNREFLFQSVFQTIDKKLWPKFPLRSRDYPIDSILIFEQQVKEEIPVYISKVNSLYDSLATVYHIRDDFKKLYRKVVESKYHRMLSSLYTTYANELNNTGLYLQKQKELLPFLNNTIDKEKLYLEASIDVESTAQIFMAKKIRRLKDEAEVKEAMDTVISNFIGSPRDFLLTKVIYTAINSRISLSKDILREYSRHCKDPEYRSIVKDLLAQKKRYSAKEKWKKENRLIAQSNDRIYTLEEVIKQQKGKVVLIDLWASWCAPCLEQHPYLAQLKQRFENDISFIYLSLDKKMLEWRQKSEELGLDPAYSFVFENFDNSSFIKRYQIENIPRYILIDKNGNVIAEDAPQPSDIELENLIKAYLK